MNVARLLTASARRHPDRPALQIADRVTTYGELDARVGRIAGGLRRLGVQQGDRVLLVQRNQPELVECLLACFRGGFVPVPLNFRLHPSEVAVIAEDCAPRAVVYGPGFEDRAVLCKERLPGVELVATCREDGVRSLDSLAEGEHELVDVDVDPEHPAWLFYTSGTTGRPKGAVMPHRLLWAVTLNYFADIGPLRCEDVLLHAAPLTHGSGLYALPGIAAGAHHVIQHTETFEPSVALELIAEHRVTSLPFLAPTMVNRLVAHHASAGGNVASLRTAVYGGAPMYVEDAQAARAAFGPVFTQVYGQGEAPTITRLMASPSPDEEVEVRRLASAGTARMNVELTIRDTDGRELPTGESGEICARGPVVMTGYWRNVEASRSALAGGWLRTGDVGYLDEQGYLFINGRSKDMIISGGSNIYAREIEEVLLLHTDVDEVAIIGVPDREWGESVRAVVVTRQGAQVSDEELTRHCLAHLASFKKPRSIVRAESLPTSPYGKVSKLDVKALYGHPLKAT